MKSLWKFYSKWRGHCSHQVSLGIQRNQVTFPIDIQIPFEVIFIDEIDSLLAARSDDDRESSRRLKTEFFVQMVTKIFSHWLILIRYV